MSSATIDFGLILNETKNTLLNPAKYFSGMKTTGGVAEPMIKAVVYGASMGIIYLICWMFKIRVFGAGNIGDAAGFLGFLRIIITTAAVALIGTAALIAVSSICKGRTDFEITLRVAASLMAVLPLYTLLSISWIINLYFGLVVTSILFLYFLWLLYYGLVNGLHCRQEYAKITGYVLAAIFAGFLYFSVRPASNSDDVKKDVKKIHRELKKN